MEAGCGNDNVITPASILSKLVCLRLKSSFRIRGVVEGAIQVIDNKNELQFTSIKLMSKAIIDKPLQIQ